MRPFISILLFLVMTAFATGIIQRLHTQEHEIQDAANIASTPHTPSQTPAKHEHSENDCPICAQFHAPMMTSHFVWLIDTGDWVPFISMLPIPQHPQPTPSVLSCRGPPAVSC